MCTDGTDRLRPSDVCPSVQRENQTRREKMEGLKVPRCISTPSGCCFCPRRRRCLLARRISGNEGLNDGHAGVAGDRDKWDRPKIIGAGQEVAFGHADHVLLFDRQKLATTSRQEFGKWPFWSNFTRTINCSACASPMFTCSTILSSSLNHRGNLSSRAVKTCTVGRNAKDYSVVYLFSLLILYGGQEPLLKRVNNLCQDSVFDFFDHLKVPHSWSVAYLLRISYEIIGLLRWRPDNSFLYSTVFNPKRNFRSGCKHPLTVTSVFEIKGWTRQPFLTRMFSDRLYAGQMGFMRTVGSVGNVIKLTNS